MKQVQNVIVSMKEVEGTTEKFSVTYPGLIDDVETGSSNSYSMTVLIGLEVIE